VLTTARARRTRSARGNWPPLNEHQIYEGTSQIQRMVMARQLLK